VIFVDDRADRLCIIAVELRTNFPEGDQDGLQRSVSAIRPGAGAGVCQAIEQVVEENIFAPHKLDALFGGNGQIQ